MLKYGDRGLSSSPSPCTTDGLTHHSCIKCHRLKYKKTYSKIKYNKIYWKIGRGRRTRKTYERIVRRSLLYSCGQTFSWKMYARVSKTAWNGVGVNTSANIRLRIMESTTSWRELEARLRVPPIIRIGNQNAHDGNQQNLDRTSATVGAEQITTVGGPGLSSDAASIDNHCWTFWYLYTVNITLFVTWHPIVTHCCLRVKYLTQAYSTAHELTETKQYQLGLPSRHLFAS